MVERIPETIAQDVLIDARHGVIPKDTKTFAAALDELGLSKEDEKYRYLFDAHYQDSLTRIHNRAYYIDFKSVVDISCVVCFIDLDHFGKINKKYGHASGDAVLAAFAQNLQAFAARVNATAIRFGGEEFLVVLDVQDPPDMMEKTKNLYEAITDFREKISNKRFIVDSGRKLKPRENDTLQLTFSAGIAPASHVPESLTARVVAYKCAEAAARKAKETGRNRICFGINSAYTDIVKSDLSPLLEMERDRKRPGRSLKRVRVTLSGHAARER